MFQRIINLDLQYINIKPQENIFLQHMKVVWIKRFNTKSVKGDGSRMINEWLESLSTLITDNMWLAPLLALFTGFYVVYSMFTFFCTIGYRLCWGSQKL